ncbi:MAG TPA: histidine kinase [Puia sp.]|nr:histidine kinase [Puia sp.]
MKIYPLIFSNNPRYRVARHILFWGCWILYYTIFVAISWARYPFSRAFFASFLVVALSMPLDMSFCYFIIYFLIPRYLYRGKYISMVTLWLLSSILFVVLFRLYTMYVNPAIYAAYGMQSRMHSSNFLWDFFYTFSQINMEGCMTAAIKLGKMWYIKQQELDLIKSEKQKIEPALHNGEMKPVFLVNALDKVELLSYKKPSVIPGMVRKIKGLLLYVIYDNNQSKVKLIKELKLLEEYVELEKEGSDGHLKVNVSIIGNMSGERIAPFIILALVENSFRQLSLLDLPDKFLNLEIRLAEGQLYINVAWSKPVDTSTLANGGNAFLQNIGKRLNLLYPHSHEMKVLIRTDQFIINCKIDLHEAVN